MAGVGDKLMTASEIKAVTDTKLAKDFSSLTLIGHSLKNDYLFAVQQSNKDQASKIAYSALGTDILNKIGSNGVVSVSHGGTGATTGASARTALDVYSKSEVLNAIEERLAPTNMLAHFTVPQELSDIVTIQAAKRFGQIMIVSVRLASGLPAGGTYGEVLFTMDNDVMPTTSLAYPVPIFTNSTGRINTAGAVWLENTHLDRILYYGDALTSNSYFTIIYGLA